MLNFPFVLQHVTLLLGGFLRGDAVEEEAKHVPSVSLVGSPKSEIHVHGTVQSLVTFPPVPLFMARTFCQAWVRNYVRNSSNVTAPNS